MAVTNGSDTVKKQSGINLVYLSEKDDKLAAETIILLEKADYKVRHFDDLGDLEAACQKQLPAAIIMAVAFNKDDTADVDLIARLKSENKHFPPTLLISDNGTMENRLATTRAGINRYFHKPLDMRELLQTLNGLTQRKATKAFRILLIDDDKVSLKYYGAILRDAGMEVETLSNPMDVLKYLAKFKPDVLVTDVYMPNCSGPELAHVIRQDDSWALMPIIFLSTESNIDRQLAAIDQGGDIFLTKPVEAEHLVTTVIAKAKRARWINRLNDDLKSTLREGQFQINTMNQHNIVSTADVTGKITYVNDKFCEISGYSRAELLGQNHRLLKSERHDQKFYDDLWKVISSGEIWHGTICNQKKNGGVYWVESTIVPFLNDKGKPYKYVSARTDVTALRESEERLNRSQSFANIGTWDWDILTGDLYWSDSIWQVFGHEIGGIKTTYKNFLAVIHPDDQKMVVDAINDCVEHRAEYNIEHRIIWPDGSSHWVQESGDVVRDKDGKPLNMLGVVQNIDTRKRAELVLAERERQLNEAQSLARIGNWQSNLATGERIWSDEVFRIIGQEPGGCDTTTEYFYNFVHPDDMERVRESAEWAEKTGHKDIVYRIILPDGSIRHVHDLAKADVDIAGNLILLSGTVQDITELVEAEIKLRETEERFTFAVEGVGDGVWDWDLKTDAMQFSLLYLSMLGYKENELPHHVDSWVNSIHPGDLARTKLKLNHYLEGRTDKYSPELRLRCKDGSYKWILCRGTVVSRDDKGQPLRMIGIHSDITKQKQTEQDLIDTREEAVEANRAKTEFLSSMSHELRTPMNAIMGFGQLLEMETDPPLSDSQQENVDEIVKASNHLLELINEVLDLARIETGRIDLSLETIVLAEVIAESLQLITPLAQQRGIEIFLTQNGDDTTFEQLLQDHEAVRADRIRLKQVLLNLLSNAIKYNSENGELIVDCNITDGERIRISITDTGSGLTEEQQAQLFKPFSRVGSDQSKVEGIGIGLVITKDLVKLMGGTIGLDSQPGVGSTFWFELPREQLHPSQKNISATKTIRESPAAEHLEHEFSILYIEDNPANLRLITQLLQRRRPNIHIWSAHEPLLGLELAAQHKPDLILLDINLARMNGFEVLKHLQKRKATRNTPVIAVSANAMPRDIKKGMKAGFADYITKPIDVDILLQAVDKALLEKK